SLRPRRAGQCARTGTAGAVSRRGARRHPGWQLGAAGQRWLGPRSHRIASGFRAVRRRRLRAQGHATGARRQRAAVCVRTAHHHPRPGAAGARLRAQPQARRHRRARAQRGCHPVRAPAHHVRLRHDAVSLGTVAVARQRAELLLGLGRGHAGRQPQLYGRQVEGGRRHDRRHAQRHQPRRFRRRQPRARPRAAVRLLRGAALFPAQTMDSQLDTNQASLADFLVRLSAGNLVARGRQMILSDTQQAEGTGATLDDLFRRAGVRRPDALALIDPPNGETITGGAPRRLTYAEADRAISALAAKLRRLSLQTDMVVAMQLANTVDSVIALLGVLRAGMIAAPLPLLWREQEMVAALSRIGAKAIVTSSHVGLAAQSEIAMQVAAELFPIRHICGFGRDLPDGVVPLDDVFNPAPTEFYQPSVRPGPAAAHVAAITFDVTGDGFVPVARSQSGLIAGGTLALHHGFDPAVFAEQSRAHEPCSVVLPGPALTLLADAGLFGGHIKNILALWRAPEQLASAVPLQRDAALVDIASFDETGLLPARRGPDGLPAPIPHGAFVAPAGITAVGGYRFRQREVDTVVAGARSPPGFLGPPRRPSRPALRR